MSAQVYVASGFGRSTTDLAWDGDALITENGTLLARSTAFATPPTRPSPPTSTSTAYARARTDDQPARPESATTRRPSASCAVSRSPSAPGPTAVRCAAWSRRSRSCRRRAPTATALPRVGNIQVQGLTQRLRSSGIERIVIGVSGGLDSTLALLVAVDAFDRMGLSRSNILAYTMPGFATGEGHPIARPGVDGRWA